MKQPAENSGRADLFSNANTAISVRFTTSPFTNLRNFVGFTLHRITSKLTTLRICGGRSLALETWNVPFVHHGRILFDGSPNVIRSS